ncbi:unnamed protein product, partial [Heterosigma akashiwo]
EVAGVPVTTRRLVVPAKYRLKVMEEVHGGLWSAHQDVKTTVERLRGMYTWPGMERDVRRYIECCDVCQQFSELRETKSNGSYPCPSMPFRVMAADFTGVLDHKPFKGAGFKHILVVMDMMSRFVFLVPTRSTRTVDAIQAIKDRVIPFCGVPAVFLTDSGPSFTSKEWNQFLRGVGCIGHQVPRGASKANGMVERMIGTVHRHLGKLMEGVPLRDFVHKLPVVETLVRNTPTAPSGLSPAEIVLGMRPRTPWDAPGDHYGEMAFVTDPVRRWQNTRRA